MVKNNKFILFYAFCCPIAIKSCFCITIPANPNILLTKLISSETCNSKLSDCLQAMIPRSDLFDVIYRTPAKI